MNVYTITDAGAVAHTLAASIDFSSYVQRIDSAAESAANHGAPIGSYIPNTVQIAYASLDAYDDTLLARWKITRTVVADPPPPAVAEVPMYRVKIVLAQQGLSAGVASYIASLSEPQKTVAQTLWDDAPNLVVQGDFALQVKTAMGLSDEQYMTLVNAALALSL